MTAKEKPKKENKKDFPFALHPKIVFLLSVPKSRSLSRNLVRDWLLELIFDFDFLFILNRRFDTIVWISL